MVDVDVEAARAAARAFTREASVPADRVRALLTDRLVLRSGPASEPKTVVSKLDRVMSLDHDWIVGEFDRAGRTSAERAEVIGTATNRILDVIVDADASGAARIRGVVSHREFG